jgi:hypothetical protein
MHRIVKAIWKRREEIRAVLEIIRALLDIAGHFG